MKFLYIIGTIFFTVYGQIVLKWRLSLQPLHSDSSKLIYIIRKLTDPYIISGFIAAFIASLCWMLALTKFQISKIYPSMSIAPMLVFLLSGVLFHEEITKGKIIGLVLILLGSVISFKF
jgi:uncharacterized membrane protein